MHYLTEVYLTFSRLAAEPSELAKKFRGRNLKIQHWTSYDHNGLKNGATKSFENSLKSMQIFQILMGGMNFRERLRKNQTSSAVRSVRVYILEKVIYICGSYWFMCIMY